MFCLKYAINLFTIIIRTSSFKGLNVFFHHSATSQASKQKIQDTQHFCFRSKWKYSNEFLKDLCFMQWVWKQHKRNLQFTLLMPLHISQCLFLHRCLILFLSKRNRHKCIIGSCDTDSTLDRMEVIRILVPFCSFKMSFYYQSWQNPHTFLYLCFTKTANTHKKFQIFFNVNDSPCFPFVNKAFALWTVTNENNFKFTFSKQ